MKLKLTLTIVCLAIGMMLSADAFAGGPYLSRSTLGGHHGLYRSSASPYSLGQIPVPPYFALHPPVYYSQPVARPYGYSPFALRPGQQPAEPIIQEVTKPAHIINPFYKGTDQKKDGKLIENKAKTAQNINGSYINNPFYDPVQEFVTAE